MTDAKHSPLPWQLSVLDDTRILDANRTDIVATLGDYDADTDWPRMEANAAFIVRAVNAHDELVDMLGALCNIALGYIDGEMGFGALENSVHEARAVLAKAEGRQ